MKTAVPRNHLSVRDAAARMGHCTRWVRERIKSGDLEGFKWARLDVTVSLESIVAFENRTRISGGQIVPAAREVFTG